MLDLKQESFLFLHGWRERRCKGMTEEEKEESILDWARSIAERVYRECADIADRQVKTCREIGEHSGTADIIRNQILMRLYPPSTEGKETKS